MLGGSEKPGHFMLFHTLVKHTSGWSLSPTADQVTKFWPLLGLTAFWFCVLGPTTFLASRLGRRLEGSWVLLSAGESCQKTPLF